MDSEEYKTGSADSENGSDNSYVQVSQEDAQHMMADSPPPTTDSPQLLSGSGIPEEDFEDKDATIYEDAEPVQEMTSAAKPEDDPFYMESHDPVEDEDQREKKGTASEVPTKSGGVEEVSPVQSGPVSSTGGLVAPKPSGYLCFLSYLHPAVLYTIYWKEPKLSAVVLGVNLVVLLTLTLNTFLHTIILLLLSFLVVSLTYIVTKIAIDSFYNRGVRNPFSEYLDQKISLPEEKIMDWTRYSLGKGNQLFNALVRLLLFENIKQSLKFGVFLWLASFVTNFLNILTAMFGVTILLFGVPPLYSKYQTEIDHAIKHAMCTVFQAFQKVQSHIPFLKKGKVE